jgi:hypothetical protein
MTTPAHFEADIDRLKEIAAAGAAAYRDARTSSSRTFSRPYLPNASRAAPIGIT